jgi:hypothetical protein
MDARAVAQLERNVQRAASAVFAGACAFAVFSWLTPVAHQPFLAAATGLAFIVAYLTCGRVLGAVTAEAPTFPQRNFHVAPVETIECAEPEELVLTDADRLASNGNQALLLDDVLAQLGPDSRVVRLFDRAAMPTAGELKSRIDRHLDRGAVSLRTPDASQALYDALAELRHELR